MGYFSNGTEGDIFRSRFCHQCQNWGRDKTSRDTGEPGCPIIDAHQVFGYSAKGDLKVTLNILIKRTEAVAPDGFQIFDNECQMFFPQGVSS